MDVTNSTDQSSKTSTPINTSRTKVIRKHRQNNQHDNTRRETVRSALIRVRYVKTTTTGKLTTKDSVEVQRCRVREVSPTTRTGNGLGATKPPNASLGNTDWWYFYLAHRGLVLGNCWGVATTVGVWCIVLSVHYVFWSIRTHFNNWFYPSLNTFLNFVLWKFFFCINILF